MLVWSYNFLEFFFLLAMNDSQLQWIASRSILALLPKMNITAIYGKRCFNRDAVCLNVPALFPPDHTKPRGSRCGLRKEDSRIRWSATSLFIRCCCRTCCEGDNEETGGLRRAEVMLACFSSFTLFGKLWLHRLQDTVTNYVSKNLKF